MPVRLVAFLLIALAFSGCFGKDDQGPAPAPEEGTEATPVDRSVTFTWDLSAPQPGQTVFFTAQAPNAIGFTWDFGDGATGAGQEAFHAYATAGIFEVTLVTSYEAGPDASASRVIAIGQPQPTEGEAVETGPLRDPPTIQWEARDLVIQFSFTFAGTADMVGWDFGDGRTSTEPTPAHAFPAPGAYLVKLTLLEGGSFYSAETEVDVDTELPIFRLSDVGRNGPEPSIGITSDHCLFFQALASTMRSCDHGDSWEDVDDLFSAPTTSDPWLWVDPVVDRVWAVNMLSVECSWIAWSDNGGDSWLANPWNCGPVPGNDHIKLGSGPWPADSPLATQATYERAVYYCVNKVPPGSTATVAAAGVGLNLGVNCSVSLDGGVTFPIQRQATLLGSGLHGAIEVGPDGTVYVPPRYDQPTVVISHDAGLTWTTRSMGSDVGTPSPRKNSEVATDNEANAYHVWVSEGYGIYMARSTNSGSSWDTKSIRVSPDHVTSATFPHIDAGDAGRIAVAYLGSENHAGNPHEAPADAIYHLYVTFSLNALDDDPQFTTVRVTDDPVQVGSICIHSGSCVGGNRNLLDFNDLHIGPDGRVYVAYADGCTGGCATADDPKPSQSRDAQGMVAILESGPSLLDAEKLTWF